MTTPQADLLALAKAIESVPDGTVLNSEHGMAILHAALQRFGYATPGTPAAGVWVPVEPTEAALAIAIPEPTHLYEGRDQEFINMMKAATALDRLTAASHYRVLVEAMTAVKP
jgi:hypothetical protein